MKLDQINKLLDAKILVKADNYDDIDVVCACGSDLMSDVMAYVNDNVLLLTGLVTPQAIRTAEMMDIHTLVFVRGKEPGEAILQLAKEKDINILSTGNTMFSACGILYMAGVKGKGD